ncbi:cation:proton antiporter [Oligoflexus tunisiensis]|uniref:cation:proton antiporter n=1 Tax=Oligoflexus tunisiensis TaxID=708132 RepID=UPI000B3107F9|nr:cation:proton antiporter [Oligoflexus tunisiensis]
MVHLPALIQDLGIVLITAAATTLIFKWLKQPVVLGYLIAGFLVGPHVSFMPNVADTQSVHVWAEIGVIFLLFGLGLEFSFKKLAKVGKSAGIAAFFEILTMTSVGYLLGRALGWKTMDSLFLGCILSMSSTTIIIRAFDELGLKAKGFVSLVFGVLIVEDLAAILILVLLTIIASPAPVSGSEVLFSTLRLGFFLLLWFVVGIYFVPGLLKKVKPYLSDETLLVVSIGLCLTMVIIATQVGFSPALGAFVMGSILAETREGGRIEHLMLPVRDLFAAVFFVSVGMMIDPKILIENFWVVLLIIVVTIVGKLFGSGLGALLSGRSLRQSMQAGLSLAQIGEFSFLIAALGVSLKVTSDFLYPIVIAVSAVTTFTTPYMIKYSGNISAWIEKRIPARLHDRLARYEVVMSTESESVGLARLLKEYGPRILLNTVVVAAISLVMSKVALPKAIEILGNPLWLRTAACILALGLCAPFLRAIFLGMPLDLNNRPPEELEQLRRLNFGIVVIRVIYGLVLIDIVIGQFVGVRTLFGIALAVLGAAIVLYGRYSEPLYQSVEKRFLANLNANDTSPGAAAIKPVLAPWDAVLAELIVSPHSPLVGHRLDESDIRGKTGATIAMIDRGGRKILAPDRSATLMPFDRISLIGNDEQLALARALIEVDAPLLDTAAESTFGLDSLVLSRTSPFIGKAIRECGLREMVHGLIVGIERGGQRILNPDSLLELQADDRLWIVGDRNRMKAIKHQDG